MRINIRSGGNSYGHGGSLESHEAPGRRIFSCRSDSGRRDILGRKGNVFSIDLTCPRIRFKFLDFASLTVYDDELDPNDRIPITHNDDEMSDIQEPKCNNLVLDAGPLLSLSPLRGLAKTYLTVPQVLAELKDRRAKEHIERLGLTYGVNIEVRNPDPASLTTGELYIHLRDFLILTQIHQSSLGLRKLETMLSCHTPICVYWLSRIR